MQNDVHLACAHHSPSAVQCNNDVCVGSNSFTVGRAAAYTGRFPPGQCIDNSDFGTWYSLSRDANCPEGQPIGSHGCAWILQKRLKTINGTCAINLGMIQACIEDGVIPFKNAANALQEALQHCPALQPPASSNVHGNTASGSGGRVRLVEQQRQRQQQPSEWEELSGMREFTFDLVQDMRSLLEPSSSS